jgi:hypothetical protein
MLERRPGRAHPQSTGACPASRIATQHLPERDPCNRAGVLLSCELVAAATAKRLRKGTGLSPARGRFPLSGPPGMVGAVDADSGDNIVRVQDLLGEAAETHHRVYRIVDGSDPDWASWYADWLINLSELPTLLGSPPVRSELVYLLVKLDKVFTAEAHATDWRTFYAQEIVHELGQRNRPQP